MNTSTELRKEILSEINKMDIIDPHTHLREDDLSSHIVDIMSYHWVLSELNSVGMDYQKVFMNPQYSLEERLKSVVPYFAKMKNTATAGCVRTIMSDLYGFKEELTEDNYKELLRLSLEKCGQEHWAEQVIQKTNIKCFATGAGNATAKKHQRPEFDLMAELNYLFWPTGSTDNRPWFEEFALCDTRYLDALERAGGLEVHTAQDLKKAVETFLHENLKGRVKFYSAYMPIEFRFENVDDVSLNAAIKNYRLSGGESKSDLAILNKGVTWKILEVLNELQTTLQIAVGAEYFVCGGRSLSRSESTWVSDMVKICYQFPNVKFDFMNASYTMMHEMEVAAKMIRNFYLENMWWHTYVPACMEDLYRKLEIIPMTKIGGFYCDAYYIELTYGKLQMVKDTIADVLCRKVENGVYTTSFALEVAKKLLYENPRDIYGISR